MFLNYRPAHLVQTKKNSYVAYSVLNPETQKYSYKRIKLNFIKSKTEQKKYAIELIKQLNYKLVNGYNPFLSELSEKLILLADAITEFLKLKKRDLELNRICLETYKDYLQNLTKFVKFINKDVFVYKIKSANINEFLDDIYINQCFTAVTRNNYLQSLKTFFYYCKAHNYISINPAAEIRSIKPAKKRREIIPDNVLNQIFSYFEERNEKFYLLACYLLYACFIRPSEICKLKISDISFKNQTIFISEKISKNKKNQTVTIPANVVNLMLDLHIYNYPSDCYIIGKDFEPSKNQCTDKILRRIWLKMRKDLKLSDNYQFYSLKDSGITKMISLLNVAEVRDQARHSNISITDVYTDRRNIDGNSHIKSLDFKPSV